VNADDRLKSVLRLIESGTPKKCLAFLQGLQVPERRALGKDVTKKFNELENARFDVDAQSRRAKLEKQSQNCKVCLYATAPVSELVRLGQRAAPGSALIVEIMRTLQPDWINRWAEDILDVAPGMYQSVRLLYESGLCLKPASEGYTLGMIRQLPIAPIAFGKTRIDADYLADRIRTTADIRDDDVWRLFRVEGGGDISLANEAKFSYGRDKPVWNDALLQLGRDGTLSRDRLLDETLEALERDFAQYRAGWFSRFHEEMMPTVAERAARKAQYLRLLGSTIPPTVSFAAKALAQVDKAKLLPPRELLDHIGPAFSARAKSTVLLALRLLRGAVKQAPELADPAAQLVTQALIHDSSDVQTKTLGLIKDIVGTPGSQLTAELELYAEEIAPSVRASFYELIGKEDSPHEDSAHIEIEKNALVAGDSVVTVVPIESFDELLHSMAQELEDPSDAQRLERMLNGFAQLGNHRPRDFEKRVSPLLKRALQVVQKGTYDRLQFQLAYLFVAYLRDEVMEPSEYLQDWKLEFDPSKSVQIRTLGSFLQVFYRRNYQLLQRLRRGVELPLLGAPTDSRGFVCAKSLVERYQLYQQAGVQPDDVDMALALLRLAPDDRLDALGGLPQGDEMADEYERAMSYALGQAVPIGETGWLWVAAAAARSPDEEQPAVAEKHGQGLPGTGMPTNFQLRYLPLDHYFGFPIRVDPQINERLSELYLSSLFHFWRGNSMTYGEVCGSHVNSIRWCAAVWPTNLEPFFSLGVPNANSYGTSTNPPGVAFIEPLLLPHVRVGPMGGATLLLGFISGDTAIRALAVDAAIVAIEQDRLALDVVGATLARLLLVNSIPVIRWCKALGQIGAVSHKHVRFVQQLIQEALRHDPVDAPRGMGALVELLYEYVVATREPISDPQALDYLAAVTGGGKLKKFAGKLLQIA